MPNKDITIQKIFDSIPRTSFYQIWVCFLCFLVMFFDGFDLTIIGVVVPKIAEFLKTTPDALGYAMSADKLGALIGAALLGMAADRFGRKWMLFASAFTFGLFTLLTAFITSVEQLVLLRFIAGLGLGGAIPTALAFGSEYAPSRSRKTFAIMMFAGVPIGSTLGGLMASYFIPHFGWQSLFVFGGIAPLVIALLVAVLLPESLEFLAGKSNQNERIRKTVSKIAPAVARDMDYRFIPSQQKLPGVPLKHLFMEGRAMITVILLLALTAAFYSLYFLLSWEPTLLRNSGASVFQYSLAFAFLNLGASIAMFIVGRLMDKGNSFLILEIGFFLGFVSLLVFGLFASGSFITVASLSILCGFFINGSFAGLLTLVTLSYPADIRGTATGWIYAVGKIGAILAPVVGRFLLIKGYSTAYICGISSVVGLLAVFLIFMLQRRTASMAARSK